MEQVKVGIVMGSLSDLEVVKPCIKVLKQFGVGYEARVISAHRTPKEAEAYAAAAAGRGLAVIIGVAGKAAHLAGVIAASTPLPVIALPVGTKMMGGLDSLLSMVQMPSDVPVATVGVDGGKNAGLLAVQILALSDPALRQKYNDFKAEIAVKIAADDKKLATMLADIE